VILGTAPYMSPEQVRGKPLDKRADIWAFGCVLYEALTGKRAFDRETVADTLAAVLDAEPDWDVLPAETTPMVVTLMRRCLQKEVRRRLHDIADARIEIDEALQQSPAGAPASVRSAALRLPNTVRLPRWARVAAGLATVGMVVAGWVYYQTAGGSSTEGAPLTLTIDRLVDRPTLSPGKGFLGGASIYGESERPCGVIRAMEYEPGRPRWDFPLQSPVRSGLLSTESDLLFGASVEGYFFALDAESGAALWEFQTGGRVSANPITYVIDGT